MANYMIDDYDWLIDSQIASNSSVKKASVTLQWFLGLGWVVDHVFLTRLIALVLIYFDFFFSFFIEDNLNLNLIWFD